MTTTVDPTAAAAGASVASKLNSSRSRLADSEQTFLSLLTTQLKNQDPLSPLDSNQFTAQLTQMAGVEQQLLTNDLLKEAGFYEQEIDRIIEEPAGGAGDDTYFLDTTADVVSETAASDGIDLIDRKSVV